MLERTVGSPVQSTSNLLTAEQAADVVHTTPLNVMRLIARKDLDATRLESKGPMLIRADALDRYASGTVIGFAMPEVEGDWFRGEWYSFNSLTTDLRHAVWDDLKTELEFDAKGKPITSYNLKMTTAIRNVLNRPVRPEGDSSNVKMLATGKGATTFRTDVTYQSVAQVAAVDRFRQYAKGYLKRIVKKPMLTGPLVRLYQSPAVYQEVVEFAERTYRGASFNITLQMKDPRGNPNHDQKPVQVTYRLPYVGIYADTARLAFLAF